jgi:2-polyprenyl-3-methyl-5-hydroxy-6-metoxy-1,4-benzoquinol methylase
MIAVPMARQATVSRGSDAFPPRLRSACANGEHSGLMPPRRELFEVPFDSSWGYERGFFLDVEHRYTKMHRLLRERYGDLAGKRILDLGSSRGLLLTRFRSYKGAELLGNEIDPAERRHAADRGIVEASAHFINTFDGNRMAARLPFADDYADVVMAGEIIEHIVDTEGFLREIHRVLRPGGALVLSTPNILWWKHRLALLAGRYPEALDYRLRYGDDFGHVRSFTPALLGGLLAETGFVDVYIVGKRLGPISTLASSGPVARALDRAADHLPKLADHLIALARAPS